MSTRLANVKQVKPGTTGQVVMTTSGGVVAWGNPLATTSAVGEVQLASQSQAWAGTPDTSSGNPLVMQPSGTLIRRNMTAGHAEIYAVSVTDQNNFTISTTNARGILAVDLQSQIAVSTEVASGNFSVAIGGRNTAAGNTSVCIGRFNTTTGTNQIAIGQSNLVNSASQNNYAFGSYNTIAISTVNCIAIGTSNAIATGQQESIAIGTSNNINSSSGANTVVGNSNTSGVNALRASIFGFANTGAGSTSCILGSQNNGNDTTLALLVGSSNSIASGGSTNGAVGSGNSIQSQFNAASDCYLFGTGNVINSATNSIAAGVSNNLQGTSGQQNLMAFGNGNTINGPGAGGGTNGTFGFGNVIGANSSRSWAFGQANSVTSIAYGNGGGIACAVGTSNVVENGELVYLFGHGNRSLTDNSNTVFADYVCAAGIDNTFAETSHTSSAFGQNNFISGIESIAVGRGNTTGTGARLSFFGLSNGISLSNPNNVVTLGNYNTVGSLSANDGDNVVIAGINNHCLSGCNVFGQGNFVTDHTFTTGNGYRCNVFGSSNGTGQLIDSCDIFGTGNFVGSSNLFVAANPSNCVTVGRNNSTTMNNTLQVGAGNIQGSPGQTATDSIFNVFVGNGNIISSGSSYCLTIGHHNLWAISSNKAIAIGYKNKIAFNTVGGFGGYSSNADYGTAIGFMNTVGSDNGVAIGLGNFAGPGFSGGSVSSIAIGILNNNDRTVAFIDYITGALTLNGFPGGLPQKAPGGQFAIGINSVAIGSENITSGLNSVAFGRRNDALGLESSALGVRCQATMDQATAIGCRAISRVAGAINFGGVPLLRKDFGEAAGTEFISFSGTQAVIQSKIVDATVAQIYTVDLPIGPMFWTDKVGVEVEFHGGTMAAAPYISWGTVVNGVYTQKYRAIQQMVDLGATGTRQEFSTLLADVGETSDAITAVSLAARIEIAAVNTGGLFKLRFYWIGRFEEQ